MVDVEALVLGSLLAAICKLEFVEVVMLLDTDGGEAPEADPLEGANEGLEALRMSRLEVLSKELVATLPDAAESDIGAERV